MTYRALNMLLESSLSEAKKIDKNPTYSTDDIDSESNKEAKLARVTKIAEFIRANCQPWLSAAGTKIVYRGVSSTGVRGQEIENIPWAFTKEVRQDRKPRDSAASLHRSFNKMIANAGLTANRSNSIFVSGDISIAREYGEVYVVFPIGDFNFTWSPDLQDWTEDALVGKEIPASKAKSLLTALDTYRKLISSLGTITSESPINKISLLLDVAYTDAPPHTTLRSVRSTILQATQTPIMDNTLQVYDWAEQGAKLLKKLFTNIASSPSIKSKLSPAELETIRKGGVKAISLAKQHAPKALLKIVNLAVDDRLPTLAKKVDGYIKYINALQSSSTQYKIQGDDGSLKQAITADHEIMISCNRFAAIRYDVWSYAVRRVMKGEDIPDSAWKRIP